MTTGDMLALTKRLKDIRACKDVRTRDQRLAIMMTDMEAMYFIPMIKDEQYNQENLYVMELFLTVSMERRL